MLIVEELHMLLLRSDGRIDPAVTVNRLYAEVAAVLVDLAVHERIAVDDDDDPLVQVISTEPTGEVVLDATLPRLQVLRGKRLLSLMVRPKLDPLAAVVESLVARGVLVRGERGFFGWGSVRTPETDPGPEYAVRARLAAVIEGAEAPTTADQALLMILEALDVAPAILAEESGGRSAEELSARIAEIVAERAAPAIIPAVGAALATVMAAAAAAATTAVIVG